MIRGREPAGAWADRRPTAVVDAARRIDGAVAAERRCSRSRPDGDAARLAAAGRRHRAIGHRRHRVLEVAFREDGSRVRPGPAAANPAVVRHVARTLPRHASTATVGIAPKRPLAGRDDADLRAGLGH